jgi:hypothetical protein
MRLHGYVMLRLQGDHPGIVGWDYRPAGGLVTPFY